MYGSFPAGFKDMNSALIGDWEAFESAHEKPSPASIRINSKKVNFKPAIRPVPWCPTGFYLPERPAYTMDPLFHAGAYYVQEPGSMLLWHVLEQLNLNRDGLKVLDLCAAPGGKSTLILDWLDGNGFLVSNEVIGKRAQVLQENLDKWGDANRMVCHSDPQQFARAGAQFDVLVVDAPCSGEGMFRKESDAVKMWNPDLVEHCHLRQCRILNDALACLKPGGHLIYSTCTYNNRENEESLFPAVEQSGADSIPLQFPAEWYVSPSERKGVHGYRCFPHQMETEGFFISVLKNPGEVKEESLKKKRRKNATLKPDSGLLNTLSPWLHDALDFAAIEHRGEVYFLPAAFFAFAMQLAQNTHALTIGQKAGKVVRNELNPDTRLALSVDLNSEGMSKVHLTDEQAIAYLRRETLHLENAPDGLVLCMYREIPIGWGKMISGRLNNRWVKEWRIHQAGAPATRVLE